MDNIPRLIFYLSSVILASSAFILLSSDLLGKVNDGTTIGTILFFGYGLIYLNMVMITSRRFMRRLEGPSPIPYFFATLIAIPPFAWVHIYTGEMAMNPWSFGVMIVISCFTGAYFGHRIGLKAQIRFQEDMRKYLEQDEKLPDDLKRSHDSLNKN